MFHLRLFIQILALALGFARSIPTTLDDFYFGNQIGLRNLTGRFHSEAGLDVEMECVGSAGPAKLSGWVSFNISKHSFDMVGFATSCEPTTQLSMSVPGSNSQVGNEQLALGMIGQAYDTYPITMRLTMVWSSSTSPEDSWRSTNVDFYEFYKTDSSSSTTTVSE